MKRYEKYKPSGVEWIGEVPEGWEVAPLKRFLSEAMKYGANAPAEEENNLFPRYIRISDIDENGKLKDDDIKSLNNNDSKDYMLEKGDLLFARSGATVGKTYLFDENYRACYAGYLIKAKCDKKLLPKFVVYYTQSSIYDNWKSASFIQSTIQNISAEKYSMLPMLVPPLPEQTAIATYLDAKSAKIDNVVAVQQKRIELLKELKQSIITHAVTRGLDKNAKLKDSGVEWIGEVPEGWKVMKLDFACKTITDYVASGSFADLRDNVTYLDDPDYAMLVRTADLSQKNKNISRVYVSKESYEFLNNSNLYGGEIVLPNIGASIGDAYMVPSDLYPKMTLAPNSVLLRTKYEDKYFYYFFCSKSGREALENIGQASAQGKFNKTDLRQMKIIVPPLSEQTAIATYLDKKCAIIDNQIAKVERQIELLKEYKQSVITECVTGKRKVC